MVVDNRFLMLGWSRLTYIKVWHMPWSDHCTMPSPRQGRGWTWWTYISYIVCWWNLPVCLGQTGAASTSFIEPWNGLNLEVGCWPTAWAPVQGRTRLEMRRRGYLGGFLQLAFLRDEKIPGARTARTARTQHARLIFFSPGWFQRVSSFHPSQLYKHHIHSEINCGMEWDGSSQDEWKP
jgi:hypothetical protein